MRWCDDVSLAVQALAPAAQFDPHPPLLEREDQLRRISAALDQASAEGELIALTGPAGTGRTRLLLEAVRMARKRSMHVIAVRVGLDDDARASVVLTQHRVSPATFVAVDDLHRCSAAAMPALVARLRHMRQRGATVLVSCRGGADLDGACEAGAAVLVHLGPLCAESTALVLTRTLRTRPADEFTAACQLATGGNPFLVCELTLALGGAGIEPAAGSSAAVRQLGLAAVGRRMLAEFGRRDPRASSVLVAAAVLGEPATIANVLALAGDSDPALDLIRREGLLLLDGELLRFAAPIVPRSIIAAVRPSELSRLHRNAAEVLELAEAPFEEIAEHLARSCPAADRSVVGRLRLGAHRARQVGDTRAAAGYLRRALEEGAGEFERDLVLELAAVLASRSPADAIVLLDRAIALTRVPEERDALAARRDRMERALLACAQR